MTLTLGMEKRMKGWPGEPQMEYDVLMADGNAAANAGRQITDVIFDFGNVLIYWDPAAVMTPRYSDGWWNSSSTMTFPASTTSTTNWTPACPMTMAWL